MNIYIYILVQQLKNEQIKNNKTLRDQNEVAYS